MRFKEFAEEWVEDTLGSLCSNFKAGAGITSKSIFDEGKYPVYGGNGLRGYTDKFNYEGDFVLIGRQGALCGNINYIKGKIYVSEHAIVIGGTDISDIKWLNYKLFLMKLGRLSESSAQPGLSVEKLKKLKIAIPKSLKEQQKIAAFLSLIDKRISTQSKIIEELKQLKAALSNKVLSQVIRFKNSNQGDFQSWEIVELGSFADISKLAGYEFTKYITYQEKGEIVALRGLNIKNNDLELSDVKYIDNSNFSKLNRSKLFVNDIMFTYIGTIGEVALIKENNKYFLGPNVSRIRVKKNNVSPNYLVQYFTFSKFKREVVNKYISSSSQPALTMENVRKFMIALPTFEEQIKIANFLMTLDEKVKIEQKLLMQYDIQKKHLLENMFI